MMKWYEEKDAENDVIVASRIRLLRNLRDYKFPWKLEEEDAKRLTKELEEKLCGIGSLDGRSYQTWDLLSMTQTKRNALRERRMISRRAANEPGYAGLLCSADDAVSLTINCEDHLRMQISHAGSQLRQSWKEMDKIDDYVNELYPYAFDDQVGYLTTYPTNIGTGMRAYLVLHLALLDSVSRFDDMVDEIGRFGLKLKPAFSSDRQLNGNMYVLYNEKTLGTSEEEILELLDKVGGQLASQERTLRDNSIEQHRLEVEDICYKAYGTIRYSKLMTLKMGMHLVSQLRWGQEKQIIRFKEYCNFYEIMMGMQEANLTAQNKTTGASMQNQLRADYLRSCLPELVQP